MAALRAEGIGIAIVDALDDADLHAMGRAFAALPVLTAGSGVAIGLPANFGLAQRRGRRTAALGGARAIVSGSCSAASNAQVAAFSSAATPGAVFAVDPLYGWPPAKTWPPPLAWAGTRLGEEPLLVYATAQPKPSRRCRLRSVSKRPARWSARCARGRGAWSGVAWRGWWWPAANLRRLRAGAGRGNCASVRRSTQRALVPGQTGRGKPLPGAQVRQLRQRGLLRQDLRVLP